jgi:hypothetical protein
VLFFANRPGARAAGNWDHDLSNQDANCSLPFLYFASEVRTLHPNLQKDPRKSSGNFLTGRVLAVNSSTGYQRTANSQPSSTR